MQVARQRSDSAAAVVSQLQVYRANGQPAAGARLDANAVVGGKELPEAAALIADTRSRQNPLGVASNALGCRRHLERAVQDGEREARLSRELPPLAPDVVVNFVPEGGTLVPGIDNRCYFASSDACAAPRSDGPSRR